MRFEFVGTVFFWKGPAPWFFVRVPDDQAQEIQQLSAIVTYGWGMIPAEVHIGSTVFCTALWPKDGSYVVPIKAAAREAEGIDEGDSIALTVDIPDAHVN